MKRWHIGGAVVALAAAHLSSPAIASGGPRSSITYLHTSGGSAAEQQRMLGGRLGVVLPGAKPEMLFLQWRLLHGLKVGPAGAALIQPYQWIPEDPETGASGWLKARALVSGVPESPQFMVTDKLNTTTLSYSPNCNDDALNTATATLKDRVQRYGGDDPAVRVWLLTQDEVFYQCVGTYLSMESDKPTGVVTPLPADAPAWLKHDRAYQEAAWAFYAGKYRDAAARFAAISREAGSPWQGMGLYLVARSYYRELVEDVAKPDTIKLAFAAVDALSAAPAGTYGQSWAEGMRRAIDFRARPAWLFNDLDRVLNLPEPPADLNLAFRDYQWLDWANKDKPKPEIADWLATVQPDVSSEATVDPIRRAQAHAQARWAKTKDVAWLIATLSLTHPGDPAAAALAEQAAAVDDDHPGWLSAQYHLMRLTIATAPAAELRKRVNRVLALPGLPQTERNLFSGVRVQLATDLADFVRYALRTPYCEATRPGFCAEDGYAEGDNTLGRTAQGWVGFGEEARAIIDRMPLDTRIALSKSPALPRNLRMDIALTNFPRAVMLQDNAAIDRVAGDLVTLLPQMAAEWRGVIAARPGEAKRFATYFAMAKIPGLRSDLLGYYRPEGTIRQFRGYWAEWMIVPKGTLVALDFPDVNGYGTDGRWIRGHADDPTCRGKCGEGAFPLHLPDFLSTRQTRINAERGAFAHRDSNYGAYTSADMPPVPKGTISSWEALLDYARTHPNDPRSPEALYWLNRITRWGANPDKLSERAFRLLHARYPGSSWAKRAPYYFN